MALSDNSRAYLTEAAKGPTVVPSIVYSTLRDLGYVTKVDGAPTQGRGRTTVIATEAGKKALV